ncbi:MAG: HAMP domain-containing sensor histidine kinase [Acidimicrobiia bacterium]
MQQLLDEAGGFVSDWSRDRLSALEEIGSGEFDLALVAEQVGATAGAELVREARRSGSEMPLIVVTQGRHIPAAREAANPAELLPMDGLGPGLLARFIRQAISYQATVVELEATRADLEHMRTASSVFLSSMNHDVRTPLTAVIGLAELLRDPEQRLDSESRSELVNTIVESGFEVANLVEDLVTAARHETGQLKVVAVPVSLRAQVNQALETLGPVAGVPVEGEAPKAKADPGRVRQIMRNLLTNAMKHGCDSVHVELGERKSLAFAAVVDDGQGVPDGMLSAIFGRDERDDGTTPSLGIGLPIARELARHMGGDLTYARTVNATRFELTLPIHNE